MWQVKGFHLTWDLGSQEVRNQYHHVCEPTTGAQKEEGTPLGGRKRSLGRDSSRAHMQETVCPGLFRKQTRRGAGRAPQNMGRRKAEG